ncbi:hypothetical protein COLO4_03779 [Corchorus olitorius]|uniref:Uncharacterized protein n=1 Tax=Corchorus olitorius TaxID=93759 RepID=A0A1R3KWR0_9ROSI|nr:hypothetical protein COLO4_03779 [Corchorus olitorius]
MVRFASTLEKRRQRQSRWFTVNWREKREEMGVRVKRRRFGRRDAASWGATNSGEERDSLMEESEMAEGRRWFG